MLLLDWQIQQFCGAMAWICQSRPSRCVFTMLLTITKKSEKPTEQVELPPRQVDFGYVRPPITDQTFVPEYYP